MNDSLSRIRHIIGRWFLSEDLMFMTYCSHKLRRNDNIRVPFRTGNGYIEYNGNIVETLADIHVETFMRIEIYRILLKHPYCRQPKCSNELKTIASDCVISGYYTSDYVTWKPDYFNLAPRETFEYYATHISNSSSTNDNGRKGMQDQAYFSEDTAELWETNEIMQETVSNVIKNAIKTNKWGNIPGFMKELLTADANASIDYRKSLMKFRANLISSNKTLTRMKPSRRNGFASMGSRYKFTTHLLIGIDVSGSVNSQEIQHFCGIINKFFNYGIETLDVAQFDCDIKRVDTLNKAKHNIYVDGRGGTSFQPIVDYAENHNYDGLIIMTDGYASTPKVSACLRRNLLFVITNKHSYNDCYNKLSAVGNVTLLKLKN